MADRHLRLVPTPDLAGPELAHAQTMQTAAAYMHRRNLHLLVTITDEDGVELDVDPASTTARGFAVRAEALPASHMAFQHIASVKVGVSDPIPRDEFLSDPSQRRSAEAEAVLDLLQQLRPHPSEVLVP
ncbi:hypothetical protein RND64_04560 [Gordonia sp. w5E2]|uniref:hypothetical protein n=1 Tax=Gordonia sp. w5E2 TaxID=3075837 RepID=UPI002F3E5E98